MMMMIITVTVNNHSSRYCFIDVAALPRTLPLGQGKLAQLHLAQRSCHF